MRPRTALRKPAIITRRLISLVIRATAITTMSFGVAFGFLSATTSPGSHYDPHLFADRRRCFVRRGLRRHGHHAVAHPADEGRAPSIWKVASTKPKIAIGNSRKPRNAPRASSKRKATSSCAATAKASSPMPTIRSASSPGATAPSLIGTCFAFAIEEQGETTALTDGTRLHDQKISRPPTAHAGSRGAKSRCAPTATARCRASAAM